MKPFFSIWRSRRTKPLKVSRYGPYQHQPIEQRLSHERYRQQQITITQIR
ncbi:hypothetical protein [Amphibacillus cookii]|nr:hypothetical protein [Amphibacillus cookii]MBM7541308.1 hypothetical protein [Amphibacillus cookii]